MVSSTQPSEPASFMTAAPLKDRACQIEKAAPPGSTAIANRPRSRTSEGSSSSRPPAATTAAAVASASAVAKETDQAVGCSGCWSGVSPATAASPSDRTV